MSQQNQQANAIRGQYGLQGNDIRGQFGLQGNDIANQQNQMGNQIRAGYGMQANDLAGALAQGRQGQLYGLEMGAPGMAAGMSQQQQDFANQIFGQRMGLAGAGREGELQDYLRRQQFYQGLMGGIPTGAYTPSGMNSTTTGGGMGYNIGQGGLGALSGALGGAALGSAIPGIGTAVGAIGGGLLGGLGGFGRR